MPCNSGADKIHFSVFHQLRETKRGREGGRERETEREREREREAGGP